MAAKSSADEQVKFLVSCIGHSTNGRPDFDAVAKELGIVTKAAAQKRFERMLKACGVSKPGSKAAGDSPAKKGGKQEEDAVSEPQTPTPRKRKAGATPATGSAKKRSVKKEAKVEENKDNAEDEKKPKPEPYDDDSSDLSSA